MEQVEQHFLLNYGMRKIRTHRAYVPPRAHTVRTAAAGYGESFLIRLLFRQVHQSETCS